MTALFQNLISNGVRYNDAQEKIIEIGLIPTSDESDGPSFETLYVRDNGIGMTNSFRTKFFAFSMRLNNEKAYGEGTGSGLTFAKKIARTMAAISGSTPRSAKGRRFS